MVKRKTSVTLEEDTIAWIDKKINEKQFASVSHAIEYALNELKKKEKA